MKQILVRSGTVVMSEAAFETDLIVRGEQISALGNLAGVKADVEIDATGLLVLPGAVDGHVRFNDSFGDAEDAYDYYSGTLAAACGGVTSVIDVSNQKKGETLLSTIETKKNEARGRALVDWGVHPAIAEPTFETLEEIPLVIEQGAPTIKCYMTHPEAGFKMDDEDLERVLNALDYWGGMLIVHAEDRALRRLIEIARQTHCRLFLARVSSSKSVEMIEEAQRQGVRVFAETCDHPGIFPKGIPGTETRLNLLYSEGVAKGRLTLTKFVELISGAPAAHFGLAPKKGTLEPGADADIVLFDPLEEWTLTKKTLRTAADQTAYNGVKVVGKIKKVFSRGELIVDGDRCVAAKGRGRYIHRTLNTRS
jgi:dihydroorotase-like cyclic amidohydrolase